MSFMLAYLLRRLISSLVVDYLRNREKDAFSPQ
jgi:hypothetical protein